MEHLQEVHPVQNLRGSAGASLHELSLISSSASPSSPPSSAPSLSPPSTVPSSFPTPPPPLHPQQVQAEQNYFIAIPILPAIPDTRQVPPPHLAREEALKSIAESRPHSMMLKKLLESEKNHRKDASSHKKAARRESKHLYTIVSMYAVLQGAIFSAVAQSSNFTCADRWGPPGIVGAFTLATVLAVLDKLFTMAKHRQEAKRFERRQSAVYDKVMQLYRGGSLCEIEDLEPSRNGDFKEVAWYRKCWFDVRGVLVLGFLLGFSALMIVSCMLMLECPPCHCHA